MGVNSRFVADNKNVSPDKHAFTALQDQNSVQTQHHNLTVDLL